MAQEDDFTRVMREGGIEDQQVLVYVLDDCVRIRFPSPTCHRCFTAVGEGERVYLWVKGSNEYVHCSQRCAERSIHHHLTRELGLEDADVYTTYSHMNFREN